MAHETRRLLEGPWAGGGVRPVYADFNALTLDITTAALFGTGLPRAQAAEVTGAVRAARRARWKGLPANAKQPTTHASAAWRMLHCKLRQPNFRALHANHSAPMHLGIMPCRLGLGFGPGRRHPHRVRVLLAARGQRLCGARVGADAGQRGVRRGRAAPGRGGLWRHRPPRRRAGSRADAGAPGALHAFSPWAKGLQALCTPWHEAHGGSAVRGTADAALPQGCTSGMMCAPMGCVA